MCAALIELLDPACGITVFGDFAQSIYGYQRIDTPLFEDSGLFHRSIGEGTDIVEKETYTFDDRSGERITLKPESTAAVCRAYLEHGMASRPQPAPGT